MTAQKHSPDSSKFNVAAVLPYKLRINDFADAMQDVYDFFEDVNAFLVEKGLQRLDGMLRAANLSGLLSDMLTASLASHSRSLVENKFHNGHPDLVVRGEYPNDSVRAGDKGVEIKSTVNPGGKVDTHGGRDQWFCVFVYSVDRKSEPAKQRRPLSFTEVYLGQVLATDFKVYERSALGTRTSSLTASAMNSFRENWIYLDKPPSTRSAASRGSASRAKSK